MQTQTNGSTCFTHYTHTAGMRSRTLSRRVVSTGGGTAGPPSSSSSLPLLPLSSMSSAASSAAGALRGALLRAPLPVGPSAEGGPRPWESPAAARASERSGLSASGALGSSVCVNVRLPNKKPLYMEIVVLNHVSRCACECTARPRTSNAQKQQHSQEQAQCVRRARWYSTV